MPVKTTEEAYQEAFEAWSSGEHAYALELCRELLRESPSYAIGRLLNGIILNDLARYSEAEELIRNTVEELPSESLHHGYMHLGHVMRDRGDYEEAEKCYHKAVELAPDNAGMHVFLGALLARKGDLKGAEASHRQATQCSSGAIDEAYLNLGLVLRAQERYGEALACFRQAIEMTPDYPEAIAAGKDVERVIQYLDMRA